MIYLIGGVPGMRKSTVLSHCFLSKKIVDHFNSTDLIRASTSGVLRFVGVDPADLAIKEIRELREGQDTGAWIGTANLINLLSIQSKDVLIEGLAITPTGILNLQKNQPSINMRGAFVGYSKVMEFQDSPWTPELEEVIRMAAGKDYLDNFAKKYNWIYGQNMYRYKDVEESERIKNAASKLDPARFRYFDLIDFIPLERRNEGVAKLHLEDHFRMGEKIRSFLLE